MPRNRHTNKPKTSDYSLNSIGGMVDVLKIKKRFANLLRDDKKTTEESLSCKGKKQ